MDADANPFHLDSIRPAVAELVEQMLGLRVRPGAVRDGEVWTCMPIAGDRAVAIWVGFTLDEARKVAARMMDVEAPSDEDSVDACREFTNWVCGWVKSQIPNAMVGLPQVDEPAPEYAVQYGFGGDLSFVVAIAVLG